MDRFLVAFENHSSAIQAASSVLALIVTVIYVLYTRKLALEPSRQIDQERSHRKRVALETLRLELSQIALLLDDSMHPKIPVDLPVNGWCAAKFLLGGLQTHQLRELITFYNGVSICNSLFQRWLRLAEMPTHADSCAADWRHRSTTLREDALQAEKLIASLGASSDWTVCAEDSVKDRHTPLSIH